MIHCESQLREILFIFCLFVLFICSMMARSGLHPTAASSCRVPLADGGLWQGLQAIQSGCVSFSALRLHWVEHHVEVGICFSILDISYSFDVTFGTCDAHAPCVVLFHNTSKGHWLCPHPLQSNCDLDVSAPVTPRVLQSAGIGRAGSQE